MSRDTVHRCLGTSFTLWLGLVVPAGVELEVAQDFAFAGGDPDVEVFDEHEDLSAGVASADADVVEAAAVAQGDLAVLVDDVVTDSVVSVVEGLRGGGCFGSGGVCLEWCSAAYRPVGA
ncbi:MAG: hypothetical protein R2726_10645 [Acidimicrobiales bacterium]